MSLRELLERRNTLRTELETIHKATPDGALPEAAQVAWDKAHADLDTLDARIARQSLIDDMDRSARGTPLDGGHGGFDQLAGQVSILDVLRAQLPGVTDAAAGRAREISAELERRSGRRAEGLLFSMSLSGRSKAAEQRIFSTTTPAGGPGSALIQTDIGPMIDILRAKLVIRALGATVLSGLTGNLSLPRLKASATAYWVSENAPITPSDPQVDQVPLTPKTVGGMTEISRNLLLQSSSDVERLVLNDLSAIIATAIDKAAIIGGGTNEPSGLLAAGSGITIIPMGATGGPLTWAALVSLIAAVDQANVTGGNMGFLLNGKVRAKLATTLKSTADTASNFILSDPNTLAGFPYQSTQNVPSNGTKSTGTALSSIVYGAWENLCVGFWSELDLAVNSMADSVFAKGNVLCRAMATADVAIRHPEAFAAITDVATV